MPHDAELRRIKLLDGTPVDPRYPHGMPAGYAHIFGPLTFVRSR
jgi:hypothetical protein